MKKFIIPILFVFSVGLIGLQQSPIPPTNDQTHKGQPSWCQNTDSPEHFHNCDCQDMADEKCDKSAQESSKCKVYCRKDACKFKTKCDHATQ